MDWIDASIEHIKNTSDPEEWKANEHQVPRMRELLARMGKPEWMKIEKIDPKSLTTADKDRLKAKERAAHDAAQMIDQVGYMPKTAPEFDEWSAAAGLRDVGLCKNLHSFSEFFEALRMRAFSKSTRHLQMFDTLAGDEGCLKATQARAMWAKNAFPFIQIDDATLAASFAATSVSADFCDDIRPPWNAFRIAVPRGILSIDHADPTKQPADCERIMVTIDDANAWTIMLEGAQDGLFMFSTRNTTAMLCEDFNIEQSNTYHDPGFRLSGRDGRTLRLAARIVLAVCIKMSSSDRPERKDRPVVRLPRNLQHQKNTSPVLQKYIFTRPVYLKTDAREGLRQYIAGKGNAPTVQTLVRGHWKRQAHGEGSKLRKFIHIEPYWKGLEGAPIAVKPHVIGATRGRVQTEVAAVNDTCAETANP